MAALLTCLRPLPFGKYEKTGRRRREPMGVGLANSHRLFA
jgi:hypothetical protein